MADVIIDQIFGKKVFSWGGASLNDKGEARTSYLSAIREADSGDIEPLISFART